ncbi:MAG: hypothetical protein AAGG08_05110 [Actinomycetota bacterium]
MKPLIAISSIAVLGLAACSEGDVSPETLTDALVEQGLEQSVAECISTDLSGQLSTEQFNDVARAETEAEIPGDLQSLVIEVTTDCLLGG